MKKIVCLTLITALLLTSLVACKEKNGPSGDPLDPGGENPPAETTALSVTGIEAAKLLLAEERLNEKLLKNKGNIFEDGVEVMNSLADKAIANLGIEVTRADPSVIGVSSGGSGGTVSVGSIGDEKQNIGKMEIVGDTVVWSELGEVSNSYEYFLNLTNNIVSEAERCANLIDFVKKYIRIVDKWVVSDIERYYLSVGENEELLCYVYDDGSVEMIIICRRYRDENGKNVYEMYRTSGSSYESRMTYIPGERYELSVNREHHFVATNTKGYWENYVCADVESRYNASYLIMKDDICYTFGGMREDITSIAVLSADRETDIFNYSPSDASTSFVLKLNGFAGVEKITAPKSATTIADGGDYAYAGWDEGIKLYTADGVIESYAEYCGGNVSTAGINVSAYGYGYGAEMIIHVTGTPEEALSYLKQFLTETGLRCSRDIDTVIAGTLKSVSDSKAVFNYYRWNGYAQNTEDGIRQATTAEKARYDEIRSYYENVKSAEEVLFSHLSPEELELHISFAPIIDSLSTEARMVGNKLTVESLTLSVNDVTLFVEDEPYRVVLALEDESGALVHLEQISTGEVKYADENVFTVTVSDVEITLPCLTPGDYRVVAYISTTDGIRSSGFDTVSFKSVESLPVNLGETDLSGAISNSGVLTLTYTERIDISVTAESATALDYEGFKQLVCEYAFKYGIPNESLIEQQVGDGYTALTGSETEIADGIYRIEYTAENGDYTRSGYVYVTYSAVTE